MPVAAVARELALLAHLAAWPPPGAMAECSRRPPEEPACRVVGEGLASWYGGTFHGRVTASGEVFDEGAMTAAHRSLPFGTELRVTNVATGAVVTLRVNDRGPYVAGRIVDCSRAAAVALGFETDGLARVRLEVASAAPAARPAPP